MGFLRLMATGSIHYGQAGAGPSVVLIHGIPTNAYLWRNVARRLIDAGREVITVDMLGRGPAGAATNEI